MLNKEKVDKLNKEILELEMKEDKDECDIAELKRLEAERKKFMKKFILLSPGKPHQVVDTEETDLPWILNTLGIPNGTFQSVRRKIGEKTFDLLVDDEFLMKEAIEGYYPGTGYTFNEVLCGNIIITKSHDEEIAGLSDDDMKYIKRYLINVDSVCKSMNLTEMVVHQYVYSNKPIKYLTGTEVLFYAVK